LQCAWGEALYLLGCRQRVEVRPGWQLVCHPRAYRASYHAQCDDPEQVAEFDDFIHACTEGMILFDVGAHFGLFALAALHYGGPRARAVAVDASPPATRMIAIQARLNGAGRRLQVVRACVCDAVGTRAMVAAGVLADGYYMPPGGDHTGREITQTAATTLDALIEQTGLTPTHVKIDVEGFEHEVLIGGESLFRRHHPLLFLELHGDVIRARGQDPLAVLRRACEYGYSQLERDGQPVTAEQAARLRLARLVCRAGAGSVACPSAAAP
jgi:FkbM family methyltransferase